MRLVAGLGAGQLWLGEEEAYSVAGVAGVVVLVASGAGAGGAFNGGHNTPLRNGVMDYVQILSLDFGFDTRHSRARLGLRRLNSGDQPGF